MTICEYRRLLIAYVNIYWTCRELKSIHSEDEFESKLVNEQIHNSEKLLDDLLRLAQLHTGVMFNLDENSYGKDKWNEIWEDIAKYDNGDEWIDEFSTYYDEVN